MLIIKQNEIDHTFDQLSLSWPFSAFDPELWFVLSSSSSSRTSTLFCSHILCVQIQKLRTDVHIVVLLQTAITKAMKPIPQNISTNMDEYIQLASVIALGSLHCRVLTVGQLTKHNSTWSNGQWIDPIPPNVHIFKTVNPLLLTVYA